MPALKRGSKSFEQYPNRETFTPQSRPQQIIKVFSNVVNERISDFKKYYHELYDLKALGLIAYSGHHIRLTEKGVIASKIIGTPELNN